MKKLIKIMFVLVSMLSFFILFNEADIRSTDNIKNVEKTLQNSYKVIIPNSATNMNQNDLYNNITEVLDEYKGNIYYSKVEMSNNTEKDIKYIYFNDLNYFDELEIKDGRKFNLDEKESDIYLSTDRIETKDQVGKIEVFNREYKLQIYTLNKLVEKGLLLDGYCYIQIPDKYNIKNLINDLENRTGIKNIKVLEDREVQPITVWEKWVVIFSLYFLIMLAILYSILKRYKDIGIKKLMGFSNRTIYFNEIKNLILNQLGIQLVVTIILCILKFNSFNSYIYGFLKTLIILYGIELVVLFIFASIPYLYINKIRISNVLKNNKPTKEIMIFNNVIKVALIIALFIVFKFVSTDFNSFKNIYSKSFKSWELTNEYAIIPYTYNMPYNQLLKENKYYKDQKEIYLHFNKEGAIYADFSLFMPDVREMRLSQSKGVYESDIVQVNPNYLKDNIIYDLNGDKIDISEEEENTILLVPDKYKIYEKEIIEQYKFWNKGYEDGEKKSLQDIKITWIKSGQELFSYNLDVNPDEGNKVKDAIVYVLTEKNGANQEYNTIMAYKGNPFKIKVDNSKSIDDNVRPKLQEVGYSQYIPTISRVSDVIEFESKNIKDKMYLYFINILFIGVALCILIFQNVISFFAQYKKYLAIRYLHGYGILERYKEFFVFIILSWIIVFTAVRIINIMDMFTQIKISLVLIGFELIVSLIALYFENKKNISNIIKGS